MRVTDKGQVTIPKELRDRFGIGAGSEVEFVDADGELVVRKVETAERRGDRIAARLRGRGDVPVTTDDLMALTRGE